MNDKSKIRYRGEIRFSIMAVAGTAVLAALAGMAGAAVVSGSMVYHNGAAAERRQLHFENRVTGDMYVAPTKHDGTFSADLPRGLYDLRAERGAILKYRVQVGDADQSIGRVVEPVPLDVHRLFQHEGIAEAIVVIPAPSTANVTGRPIEAMRYGHESVAAFGAPLGTPVPESTPFAESTPAAAPSPAQMK